MVIGTVIWLAWSAKSEQAARDLIEAQTELNLQEAQQRERLLDAQVEFGYVVFGHGSKGKTYELCLKYPPAVKENQKQCELLAAEIKRKEKALKLW